LVQVDNYSDDLPQSGLNKADVFYEYVTEGGISRFTLLFFKNIDAKLQVGPVRSARNVSVLLAKLYGGFLVYSGASAYVQNELDNGAFPFYDEDSAQGGLFRISSRYAPHNLYTDGSGLAQLAKKAALPNVGYQLWGRAPSAPANGVAMGSFTVNISDFEQPTYTWHPELKGYTRSESDTGAFVDGPGGGPVVVPTVVVQQVSVTTNTADVEDVSGAFGVDHDIQSSGTAQIFIYGKEYDANWTQPQSGPPQFSLADGSPAPLAPGEVWICLVPTGQGVPVPTPTPSPSSTH
jgi:hypothetical protein